MAKSRKKKTKKSAKRASSRRSASRPAKSSTRRAKKSTRRTKVSKPVRKKAAPKKRAKPTPKRPAKKAAKKKPARKSSKAPKKRPAKKASKASRARDLAKKKKALAQKQKSRERDKKAREKKAREKERAQLLKKREQAKKQKERERIKAQKERERERARREQEKLNARLKKEREKERARIKKEKAAQKEAERKEREAERARIRAEKEAERERLREEARKKKEEERARREAEREAYRKAKETERARIRAEKEAQRRALEGRVARASGRAQRGAGSRSSTQRVYSPNMIPNQSGTTKHLAGQSSLPESKFANLRLRTSAPVPAPNPSPMTAAYRPPTARPPPKAPPARITERYASVRSRLTKAGEEFQREYRESLDMSWIYHDSALEGVVYTFQELKTAIDPNITVVPDSSLQPVCEEIRRHKSALDLVRELAEKRRVPLNIDVIKRLYLTLHPDEGDLKSVKYRKDIPQHRLYFHEYSTPDKIAYKVRQVVDWLNGPEPKKIKDPIRIAARAHYDLLRAFPFSQDSGKVSRMFMNIILIRSEYPPVIIHSTERQRYYEALKGNLPAIFQMATDAITNGLQSIEKKLDEEESRARAFVL